MKSYEKVLEDGDFIEKKELSDGTIIFKSPGRYGPKDFRVRAYNPKTKFKLQPKHAHFAIDFYGKLCSNKEKTLLILKAIIEVWNRKPVKDVINKYEDETKGLPGYDLEYILYALEWILEQEDINFKGRPEEKQQELDNIFKTQNVVPPRDRGGSHLAIALFCDIANGTHPIKAFIRSGLRI